MEIEGRESGLALIVTLLLGLIAAAFIGALMYIVTTGSWISGMEARYTSSLQAAKGGASYIMRKSGSSLDALQCNDGEQDCFCDIMEQDNDGERLKCPNSTSFVDTVTVDMGNTANLGDYTVDGELLSKATAGNGSITVFSFDITAQAKRNTEERSNIELIYKVEW